MKKMIILCSTLLAIALTGCSLAKKNNSSIDPSNDTRTTSEQEQVSISQKEYTALVGLWECLDEAGKGDEVSIKQNDDGLTIQYAGEEETATKFIEKKSEKNSIYFRFENKNNEMAYMIDLKADGMIILNRGTTNAEMTGESKPMEYKKIKTTTAEKPTTDKGEANFTLQVIKEEIEKTGNFEMFKKEPDFEDDNFKVLAIQESDGYSFISGPDNGEPAAVVQDESGNTIREDNPSTDPRATTLKEARELIETLKNNQLNQE
ncbi:hypothetical protein ATZ33_02720 [Enterococcus silesiacus]|uniref:Lipoprotein n=1 Tax=Enterococcus silesiacus TaxID=332949 RepID=A0A0S3K7W5_9ENTE|nr:hypothetical protein [Enterococcus silesiacus]ALS00327.1 hypothetical protein ATZ33_02720 [Enterococcus silesiacus]OJG93316.1 hypothetical protein RV15_GL001348 [Enterococcus silesiacus]